MAVGIPIITNHYLFKNIGTGFLAKNIMILDILSETFIMAIFARRFDQNIALDKSVKD